MVRRYPGGSAALAARMDMSPTTLAHKASPTYEGQFFSPEEVVQLTDETGDNDFLNSLAAHRHCIVLPMPQLDHSGMDDVCTEALITCIQQFAEFSGVSAKALSPASPGGRRVTDNEQAELEREAAEAIAAIQEMVLRSRALNQERKPAHLRAAA
jgi:hypothetical protein